MFKMILANDIAGGIGKENQLPWPRNDKDMQWVKEHTKNAILICGRKTYESLPKFVRSGRYNNNKFIIITNNPTFTVSVEDSGNAAIVVKPKVESKNKDIVGYHNAIFTDNLNSQVQKLSTENTPVFVFGGAEIYNLLLDKCDKLYISTFDNRFDCDTFIDRDHLTTVMPYCEFREEHDDVIFEIYSRFDDNVCNDVK